MNLFVDYFAKMNVKIVFFPLSRIGGSLFYYISGEIIKTCFNRVQIHEENYFIVYRRSIYLIISGPEVMARSKC